MKIAIYVNQNKPLNGIDELIAKEAMARGYSLDEENPDVVFYVGGDGTFLRAVHHYLNILDKVCFIGICNGNFGFFYDFAKEDISPVFSLLQANQLKPSSQTLLEAKLTYQDSQETIYAINEIRIENPFHTLICDVIINGDTLETFRGNGLVVSSALGSSAYNRSLGGALIDQASNMLELTEIATIQNNLNGSLGSSLVMKEDSHITFAGNFANVVVGYDNQIINKNQLLRLDIANSGKVVTILRSPSYSYIQSLKRSFVK